MNYNNNIREKNTAETIFPSNSKYVIYGWNYTVTSIWFFCLLSVTDSSCKKRIPSKSLEIPFCNSYYIKAWVWVQNAFITFSSSCIWGLFFWQDLVLFILFFCTMDFQVLLLWEKIIGLNWTLEKENFKKYFIIECKRKKKNINIINS